MRLSVSVRDGIDDAKVQVTGAVLIAAVYLMERLICLHSYQAY